MMCARATLLFAFTFLATCTVKGQDPLSQPITISFESFPLELALEWLIDSHDCPLSFSSEFIPQGIYRTGNYKAIPLQNILDDLLLGTSLVYKIVGNQILLVNAPAAPRFHTISGWIEDAHSGEKLIGANVYEETTQKGTSSNAYGFFSLTLPEGFYYLRLSYLGYEELIYPLELNDKKRLNFRLVPGGQLAEILVLANTDSIWSKSQDLGMPINLAQMQALPALGGEPDLVRYSSLLPGVMTGTDGFGGLHVRGGNADQNLFLLDGVPVYSPSHAAGMLSIFDSPSIRSAQLYKGGFPARYGGRLSSVYDVRMKEGNNRRYHGEASLGLIAAKVAIEGPIEKGESSFFVSARRTIMDPWVKGLTRYINQERGNSGFTNFTFYDVNVKMNFKSGDYHRFYVSLYTGNDSYHQEEGRSVRIGQVEVKDSKETDMRWGNTIASLRWNWLLHPKWFLNTTVYSSTFNVNLLDFYEFSSAADNTSDRQFDLLTFSSLIQDNGLRTDGEYHPNHWQVIRFGGSATRHRFRPGVLALTQNNSEADIFVNNGKVRNLDSLPDYKIIPAFELEAYIEDEINLGKQFTANLGLYFNRFMVQDATYQSLQPRIFFQYRPFSRFIINATYGLMTQNLHLLTNSGLGLPSDLWVPVSKQVAPLQSRQAEITLISPLSKSWEIRLSAFSKTMENILAWKSGADFQVNGNILQGGVPPEFWEEFVTTGTGRSEGIEFSLVKTNGNLQGGLYYTLSKTDHQFAEINEGKAFPFRYDRRHVLNIPIQYLVSKQLSFNSTFTYASGNPITLPTGTYDVHSLYYIVQTNIFSSRNGHRLQPYHRLDFNMQYVFQINKLEHTLSLGIFNIYNRLNPLYVRVRRNNYNPNQRDLVAVSLAPMLPIFQYRIRY